MAYSFADFNHMAILLSTEICVDSHKTEIFSFSKMFKHDNCIKYFYVLHTYLFYIPDPLLLAHLTQRGQ